jgi:protein-tyrosine phosphatase
VRDPRDVDWEGCLNARDLGGLPAAGGRRTRWGAVVRADAPDHLTAAGWAAVRAHGVRTVVDLRNEDELTPDAAPRPDGLTAVHVALDGIEDRGFLDAWDSGPQCGTPLFYRPHLERFPERHAAVVRAVARAPAGGVVVHCGLGRDRTGLVAAVLLMLAGVAPEVVAADHALSAARLPPLFARRGEPDQAAELERFLAGRGTTAAAALRAALDGLDLPALLRDGGLAEEDLVAVQERLAGA